MVIKSVVHVNFNFTVLCGKEVIFEIHIIFKDNVFCGETTKR